MPSTTKSNSSKSPSQSGPMHHSSSNEKLTPLRQPTSVGPDRRQADPYFAQEFPQLSSTIGGNSSQPQSAKDISNVRQGSRGGIGGIGPYHGEGIDTHRQNHSNLSYIYKDTGPSGAEEDVSLPATNMLSDGQSDLYSIRHNRNISSKSNLNEIGTHHFINNNNNLSPNDSSSVSTSISSNPNFLLPDPPISSATCAPNSTNPLSNQQQKNNYVSEF